MKEKNSLPTIGIIGLGAVGFMLTNQLLKSNKGYIIKLLGKKKALKQFKNYFIESPAEFCQSYKQFFSKPHPNIILLAIPNPIDATINSISKELKNNKAIKSTTIVPLQNGVSAVKTIQLISTKYKLNQLNIVKGCITNASTRNSPISLKPAQYNPKKLFIALAKINSQSNLIIVIKLFQNMNFIVKKVNNLASLQWSKLISGNLSGYSTAVTFMPLIYTLHDNDLLRFEIKCFKERLKIINKAKIKIIDLPGFKARRIALIAQYLPTNILIQLKTLIYKSNLAPRSNTMPSTAKKILAGKKTEVDYYLKPIIDLGNKYNQNMPIAKKLYSIIKQFETGQVNPKQLSLNKRKLLLTGST
ncbi:MAG: ketopantoate reductase C-terminal domain-containing protein [Candidatus Beckwithbacteria bacterium]|nr:hypothetical protein [Patescibacteria group bacterium]